MLNAHHFQAHSKPARAYQSPALYTNHYDSYDHTPVRNNYARGNQQLFSLFSLFSMMQMMSQMMNAWSGFGGYQSYPDRVADEARPPDDRNFQILRNTETGREVRIRVNRDPISTPWFDPRTGLSGGF